MQRIVSIALVSALASCGSVTATQEGTTPPPVARAPSPGPRGEDAIDDGGLVMVSADVDGRTGEDLARARARLVTDQTRAFLVAVVHAMPAIGHAHATHETSGDAGAPVAAAGRFDPPATLIDQLGGRAECSNGGDAHRCAARLGSTLLERINGLDATGPLAAVKEGLQASMAALDETRVPVPTEVRWRVLQQGDDPAAHLAQALTWMLATRHIAQAIEVDCPCDEAGRLAGRLADELAIGPCADAFERMLASSEGDSGGRSGLATLAASRCAPACAVPALSGRADDVVLEAAHACRGEATPVSFAPFTEAAHAIGEWARGAQSRLAAVHGDPAVHAILENATTLPPGAHLPLPPPLFVAGGGTAVEVPSVPGDANNAMQARAASALVWLPATGDALVTAAPRFTLDESAATTVEHGPVDGLRAHIDAVLSAAHADPANPVALVADRNARAPRLLAVLEPLTHGAPAEQKLFSLAVRQGAFSRYVPLRVVSAAPETVFRVGERQITVVEHGNAARVVAIAAPQGTNDTLGGAIPTTAPAAPFAIQLEPDASGATLARVANALATHGASATTPLVPGLLTTLAEGALVSNVADAARATALRTAIDAHRAEAAHCLETVAPAADGAPARVDLHLTLDARGRITHAEAQGDSARSEAAAQCVTTATRRWHLPAAAAGAEIRALYVVERPAAP